MSSLPMADSFRTNDGDDLTTDMKKDLSLRCAIRTLYALQKCSDLYEQRGRHVKLYRAQYRSFSL